MFDFEKLTVYTKVKEYNKTIMDLTQEKNLHRSIENQLVRASSSIMLNIAEGSGRLTNPDKRRFFIIARGSTFECVAILDYLKDCKILNQDSYRTYYTRLDEISRMLFSMIKHLERKKSKN